MKIICIIGKSASGKTYLLNKLKNENNIHSIITSTSRPIRVGETQGVDYNFYSKAEFEDAIEKGKFVEYELFNDWYYGTSYDSFSEDKVNLIVINPSGFKNLCSQFGNDSIIAYYINTPFLTRLKRYIKREGKFRYEIFRRMVADYKDFKGIEYHNRVITFYNYDDVDFIAGKIRKVAERWKNLIESF